MTTPRKTPVRRTPAERANQRLELAQRRFDRADKAHGTAVERVVETLEERDAAVRSLRYAAVDPDLSEPFALPSLEPLEAAPDAPLEEQPGTIHAAAAEAEEPEAAGFDPEPWDPNELVQPVMTLEEEVAAGLRETLDPEPEPTVASLEPAHAPDGPLDIDAAKRQVLGYL